MSNKSLLSGLHTQLAEKQADAKRISDAFDVDEKGRFTISKDKHRDYVAAVKGAEEIKSVIDAQTSLDGIGAYLAEPDSGSNAGGHYGQPAGAGTEVKTLGDMVIGSDAYKAAREAGVWNRSQPISIHAEMEGKSMFSLSAGTISRSALGEQQDIGFIEARRRKWHIRDLFPKATTKASSLVGLRETGWVNNAKQVKERYAADGVTAATGAETDVYGAAPKSKLIQTPFTAPVAEIAHLLDAHKNVLSDEGRLRNFINTRMVEGVKFAEDYDLLHSVGDGEKITGLFNTPGVQTYAGLATDKYSVQIRRAITRSLLAEYEPSGVVLSPQMFEEVEIEEDDTGAFRVAISVALGAEKKIWRLNVVETTAMADANYLVGSFGMGASLYDREAVSVTASSEHSDNYARGVITFRADERLALLVERPESFVVGSWTAPAVTP